MHIVSGPRGFRVLAEKEYLQPFDLKRIIQESSAIGDYDDAWDNPGSSFLWVGEDHHLDREQVRELISHMEYWLKHKRLQEPKGGSDAY